MSINDARHCTQGSVILKFINHHNSTEVHVPFIDEETESQRSDDLPEVGICFTFFVFLIQGLTV
jgi:hypothetical protein